MILLFAFVFLSLISFGIFAFVMRPTSEQKAVRRRVLGLKAQQGTLASVSKDLQQYLAQRPSGSFQWLENLVKNLRFSQRMQALIIQANVRTTVGTVLMWSAGSAFAASLLVFLFTGMFLVAAGVGAASAMIPMFSLKMMRGRRVAAFNKNLPESVDTMTRSLRAGHSVIAAISIIAEEGLEPNKTEFGEVFKKQNYGLPLRDALMQMLERVPSQDLRVLITAILVQKDTGGNLAEILDRTVFVIRERMRIKGEIQTHTAQGRMTGWILCLLPVVMLVLINIVNPGYSKVLLQPGMGREMLYVGLGLLCVGGLVIRQIINGIEV